MKRLAEILKNNPDEIRYIAYRMQRHTATITRWARGETNPSPAELEKLNRILNKLQLKQQQPQI